MLSKSKSETVTSTVSGAPKKGNSGRLEMFAQSTGNNTFNLTFQDVGNYGRLRYQATISDASAEEIRTMALSLLDLVDGHINNTQSPSDTASSVAEKNNDATQGFSES